MYFDRSIKNVMLLNKRESKYEKFQIAMFDKKLKFLDWKKSTYHDICRSSLCMSNSNHLRYITIIW